jgi:O-antigen ligase
MDTGTNNPASYETAEPAIAGPEHHQGVPGLPACNPQPQRESRLEHGIFACLLLFAAALPHSKAVTEIAYSAAMALWVVNILAFRKRPLRQPLTLALFVFLLFSAISSALSPVPALSLDRMKSVGLLIISVLVAQNVRNMREVRILVSVLLVSTAVSIGYNGWLYTDGIGARITAVPPASILNSLGVQPGDIITAVDGRPIRNPAAFLRAIQQAGSTAPLRLQLARGEGLVKFGIRLDQAALINSGITQPGALALGQPPRAKGSLGYVVTYAEVLLQAALLTWGFLLSAVLAHKRWKWALFPLFGLMCVVMGLTATRASLLSLFVAGFVVFWLCTPRAVARVVALAALALAILGISFMVRRERGLGMIAPKDPGTEYRILMWEDGVRLAREHPLFGVGMDTIKARWQQLHIRAYERFPLRSHFHSTPIQLAAERGLLTLASWIWLMFLYLRLLFRLRPRIPPSDWFARGVCLGIVGSTLGFFTSSLVHYNLGDSEVQMLFWFLMGIAIALDRIISRQEPQPVSASG